MQKKNQPVSKSADSPAQPQQQQATTSTQPKSPIERTLRSSNPVDHYNPDALNSSFRYAISRLEIKSTRGPFSQLVKLVSQVACPVLDKIEDYILIAEAPLSTVSLLPLNQGVTLSDFVLMEIVLAEEFLVDAAALGVDVDESKLSISYRIRHKAYRELAETSETGRWVLQAQSQKLAAAFREADQARQQRIQQQGRCFWGDSRERGY